MILIEATRGMGKIDRDTAYFSNSGMVYNSALLIAAIIIWGMNASWYPSLDGVSVYEIAPTIPKKDLFKNIATKTGADDIFSAEATLLNYCIFPQVYNQLITKSSSEVLTHLGVHGLSPQAVTDAQGLWNNIDFSALRESHTEYSLPYDDLVVPAGRTGISSQFFPPLCRCMNKVYSIYGSKTKSAKVFQDAQDAVDACMATRHLVKRQTLMGDSTYQNTNIKSRKYISRHALLFQLCAAFSIGALYNRIDFVTNFAGRPLWEGNSKYYAGLVVVFFILWFSSLFALGTVDDTNSITFGTITTLPAFALGIPVEFMWSFVAKHIDIGRQTYMHPLSFYVIISSLYTIALVENGVFTLSVIVTHIFQSNALSIAYAGLLFISHGKIWQTSDSSRTGLILLLFLPATMHIFHMVPLYPVNCELNILWGLPVIFSVICYAKVLFIDHFMGDESSIKGGRYKITHSDHLLNIGQLLVIAIVVFYYVLQLANLQYGLDNSFNMASSGGRLSKRLNFEFGEVGITGSGKPLYSTPKQAFAERFYINP